MRVRARTQQLVRLLASAGVLACLLFAATAIGAAPADAASAQSPTYAGNVHLSAALLAPSDRTLRLRPRTSHAPLADLPATATAMLAVGAYAGAVAKRRPLAHAHRRWHSGRAPPRSPH
jgi:hypothetical protein